MVSFYDAVKDAAKTVWCAASGLAGALWDTALGNENGLSLSPDQFGNLVSRLTCNKPPEPSEEDRPPTCWPKNYRIDYTVFYKDLDEVPIRNLETTSFVIVRGPIRKYEWEFSGQSDRGPAGLYVYHSSLTNPDVIERTFMFGTSSPNDGNFRFTINGVTDQSPSTPCALPPVTPPPPYSPGDWTGVTNVNFTYVDGLDLTVPVAFFIGLAKVDINGEFVIPVNLDFSPNINIDPTFDFNVDIDIPINGDEPRVLPPSRRPSPPPDTSNPPIPREDDYEPFPPPPTKPPDVPDPSDPDTPEPTQRCVIKGAIVTTTSVTPTASPTIIGQGDNPDIYAPSLGYINFAYRVGSGSIAWGNDLPVKNRRHFIEVTWPAGAVDVKGTPKPGVTWNITPIWECTAQGE